MRVDFPKRIGVWFAVFVVVILAAIVSIPIAKNLCTATAQSNRLNDAKGIALACKLYAMDHKGHYPDRLEDLVPTYLSDKRFLVFHSTDGKRELRCEYFGGTDTDRAGKILLRVQADKPEGDEAVAFSDGSGRMQRAPATP
jgi:hypothetical protein